MEDIDIWRTATYLIKNRDNAERRLSTLATMTLNKLIEGKQLSIQRNGHDRFGRTLAYVGIRGGADVGELLIGARVAVRWGNGRPDWCSRSKP